MSKSKIKRLIILGIITVICMVGASAYALNCNGGRLVYPMNFKEYHFMAKDLPMIGAMVIVLLYVIYLAVSLVQYSLLERRNLKGKRPGKTRRVNPKLGYFGFFGFAGFFGIFTYLHDGTVFPFCFIVFFGFFGFFYEGKMSNILADERFLANKREAERKALGIGYKMSFLLLVLAGIFLDGPWLNLTAILLICGMSLILGLVQFLSEYLLYRYDRMDSEDWSSEEDV